MNIKVNRNACLGCGTCVAFAGQTFKIDMENKAVPIEPAGDELEMIKLAAESCPVGAILIK